LLIVLVIIGGLAAIATPNFQAARGRSNERAALANLKSLSGALEMYNLDYNSDLKKVDRNLLQELKNQGYLQQVPSDQALARMNTAAAKLARQGREVPVFEAGAHDKIVLPSKKDWLGLVRPARETRKLAPLPLIQPGFTETLADRLSTFGIEVDTAAYTVVRAALEGGRLPDPEQVRVEEMVNFFKYDDPAPEDSTFAIHLEGAPSPYRAGRKLLRVALKARESGDTRPPAHLTFVIDVSGSMGSRKRLPLVKEALGLLVENLRKDDTVCLVTYGGRTGVLLPHTPARQERTILKSLDGLRAGGSTNVEAGLTLGYQEATRHLVPGHIHRVILATDGLVNRGATYAEPILKRVAADASKGILLTTVGFGMGHQDQFMERLADAGDGVYAYVDRLEEARRLFVEDLVGTLHTVAQEARIQVSFNPQRVRSYRLIGYENRAIADQDFRNDSVDAGEIGAGHEVSALYELELLPQAQSPGSLCPLGQVHLRWREGGVEAPFVEIERNILPEQMAASAKDTSPRFRLASLVARFAEWLRQSRKAAAYSPRSLLPEAQLLARELAQDKTVAELARLIERAAELAPDSDK
jgi:Ca-activated chloride channel family protein